MSVYLDAKDVEATELIVAIQKFQLEERHVVYQSLDYCKRISSLEPKVRTLPPLKQFEQLDAVAAIRPYGVDAAWSILSEELIADCHKRGIKVFSDAIGQNESVHQYKQAIGWGIDCIKPIIHFVFSERSKSLPVRMHISLTIMDTLGSNQILLQY